MIEIINEIQATPQNDAVSPAKFWATFRLSSNCEPSGVMVPFWNWCAKAGICPSYVKLDFANIQFVISVAIVGAYKAPILIAI